MTSEEAARRLAQAYRYLIELGRQATSAAEESLQSVEKDGEEENGQARCVVCQSQQ